MSPMGQRLSDIQKAARQQNIRGRKSKEEGRDYRAGDQECTQWGEGSHAAPARRREGHRRPDARNDGRPPQPPFSPRTQLQCRTRELKAAAPGVKSKTSVLVKGYRRGGNWWEARRRWVTDDNIKENDRRGRNDGRPSPETPPGRCAPIIGSNGRKKGPTTRRCTRSPGRAS